MKIRPVGAELFHADGQTDMTKLVVFCVIITEEYNFMVNSQELIGTQYIWVPYKPFYTTTLRNFVFPTRSLR